MAAHDPFASAPPPPPSRADDDAAYQRGWDDTCSTLVLQALQTEGDFGLRSVNAFFERDVPRILNESGMHAFTVGHEDHRIILSNHQYQMPHVFEADGERPILPSEALATGTYAASVLVDVTHEVTDTSEGRTRTFKYTHRDVVLARIPIPVGCALCWTRARGILPDAERYKQNLPVPDAPGYFIVGGAEKVYVTHVIAATNTPIVIRGTSNMQDKGIDYFLQIRQTRSLWGGRIRRVRYFHYASAGAVSRNGPAARAGSVSVELATHNAVVPLLALLRALGVKDAEVMGLVADVASASPVERRIAREMQRTLEAARLEKTPFPMQEDALELIGRRVLPVSDLPPSEYMNAALCEIDDAIFAGSAYATVAPAQRRAGGEEEVVPPPTRRVIRAVLERASTQSTFRQKAVAVGHCVRRLLFVALDTPELRMDRVDDEMHMRNWRGLTAGRAFAMMFEEQLKVQFKAGAKSVKKAAEKALQRAARKKQAHGGRDELTISSSEVVGWVFGRDGRVVNTIGNMIARGVKTGNFATLIRSASQPLDRQNLTASRAQMRRLVRPDGGANPRANDPRRRKSGSKFATTCPHGGPEGAKIGLDEYAAMCTYITVGCTAGNAMKALASAPGVGAVSERSARARQERAGSTSPVPFDGRTFVNGILTHVADDPAATRRHLVALRRRGAIEQNVSITMYKYTAGAEIRVETGPGRFNYPVFRVDDDQSVPRADVVVRAGDAIQRAGGFMAPGRARVVDETPRGPDGAALGALRPGARRLVQHDRPMARVFVKGIGRGDVVLDEDPACATVAAPKMYVVNGQFVDKDSRVAPGAKKAVARALHVWLSRANKRTGAVLEWLDSGEVTNTMMALTVTDVRKAARVRHALLTGQQPDAADATQSLNFTHLFVATWAMVGLSSSMNPLINHQPGPRTAYGDGMGKQAQGERTMPVHGRLDRERTFTWYSHRQIVTTRAQRAFKRYTGVPCNVAIYPHRNTQEDAIVMNKAFLDRGAFRYTKLVTVRTRNEGNDKKGLTLVVYKPDLTECRVKKGDLARLDDDGLPAPGTWIAPGDVVIGRVRLGVGARDIATATIRAARSQMGDEVAAPHMRWAPVRWPRHAQRMRVVSAGFMSDDKNNNPVAFVTLTASYQPEIGNKFATPYAQKGTLAQIIPPEDMPFDHQGISPDLIFNPHGIPTRMTVSHLFHMLAGLVACVSGRPVIDGTPWTGEFSITALEDELHKRGFQRHGNRVYYDGHTGRKIEAQVFTGVIYYQALKHISANKVIARARGPRTRINKQPTKGRRKFGALRAGGMEVDAKVAHGTTAVIKDRLLDNSDGVPIPVCDVHGTFGWMKGEGAHMEVGCHECTKSGALPRCSIVYTAEAFVRLVQELNAQNVSVLFETETA